MINHIFDVLICILIFLLISLSFLGWGNFILSICNASNIVSKSVIRIWIGLISSVFLVELFQFFHPLTIFFNILYFLIGIIFSFKIIKFNIHSFNQIKFNFNFFIFSVFLVFLFLLISITFFIPLHYDVDLYYKPTVDWLNHYSISFGLGNLHSRLAYNQSLFILSALFNFSPYWPHGLSSVNLYLTILTLITIWVLCSNIKLHGRLLLFFLLITFIDKLYSPVSPSPDFTVFLLQILIFIISFTTFSYTSNSQPISLEFLIFLIFLFTFSISVKLSNIFYVFSFAFLILTTSLITIKSNFNFPYSTLFICFSFLLVHFLRGYVLSGYPLFPSSLWGLNNAPWSLPIASVENEVLWIYGSARVPSIDPNKVLDNWNWVPMWYKSLPFRFLFIVYFSVLLISFSFLIRILFFNKKKLPSPRYIFIFIPLLVSILSWFFTAPDIRFIGAVPELFFCLSLIFFVDTISKFEFINLHKSFILNLLLIIVVITLFDFFLNFRFLQDFLMLFDFYKNNQKLTGQNLFWHVESIYWRLINLSLIISSFLYIYFSNIRSHSNFYKFLVYSVLSFAFLNLMTLIMGFFISEQKGWQFKPTTSYSKIFNNFNLEINTPTSGDQCGNAPFPCTPYIHPNLHAIDDYFKFPYINFGFKNLSVK